VLADVRDLLDELDRARFAETISEMKPKLSRRKAPKLDPRP